MNDKNIEVGFWNRKRGDKKISLHWKTLAKFQTWLTCFEGTTGGQISLKHNGGYGKNNKTGHTCILTFSNQDNEGIADLIRPIVSFWK